MRRTKKLRNADGVRATFGVEPALIPDFLALVGDAADGYSGIAGIGAISAARLLNRHGTIERFPPEVLGDRYDIAILFKKPATLRTDAPLFRDVAALQWRGPTKWRAATGVGEYSGVYGRDRERANERGRRPEMRVHSNSGNGTNE